MKFQNEAEIALWQQVLLTALQFGNDMHSKATNEADATVEAFRERMSQMEFIPTEEPPTDEGFEFPCPGYKSQGLGIFGPCTRCGKAKGEHE